MSNPFSLAFCLAFAIIPALSIGQDRPATWNDWQMSTVKGDKEIVAKLTEAQWWDNCIAWGIASRQKNKTRRFWALQDYLLHRNLVNGKDLGGVNDRLPAIGMSTCGAYAVLGRPDSANHSESQRSHRSQYVFRSRGVYVYTESTEGNWNALVTSLQY